MAKDIAINTVVIPGAGTTSAAHTVKARHTLIAFQTPAALTGTAFTFEQSSDDGTTWQPVYNESTAYSVTVGTSRYCSVNPNVFAGVKAVRVVSGSTEGSPRTITLITGE